jgi:hypothetical protein
MALVMIPAAPPVSERLMASARNWMRICLRLAPRAAQPNLRPALQDADHHDVGHADGADQQGDSPEAEQQGAERAPGVGLGDQGAGGLGNTDGTGILRVGLTSQQAIDAVTRLPVALT